MASGVHRARGMTRAVQRPFLCSLAVLPIVLVVLVSMSLGGPAHASADPPAIQARAQLQGQLNINTATAQQWDLLPGIGPATAQKIVAYRHRRPFRSLSHVMRVKGIGRKTFADIRPYLTLTGATTLAAR